jgi:histidinol-phosphate/aromatic aminotransferase/cobyric acid decarboxylase-like protein
VSERRPLQERRSRSGVYRGLSDERERFRSVARCERHGRDGNRGRFTYSLVVHLQSGKRFSTELSRRAHCQLQFVKFSRDPVRTRGPRRRRPSKAGPPLEYALLPFPLARWIDDHSSARFSLASSGMSVSLRSTEPIVRGAPRATVIELRDELAGSLGVDRRRIFLTHGATEGNGLVLWYLSQRIRKRRGGSPSFKVSFPEYPSLIDAPRATGFRPSRPGETPDLFVGSDPKNPTGQRMSDAEYDERRRAARQTLIDETYREFTTARSRAGENRPARWFAGTLTKVYGADSVRLGWVVAPPEETGPFGRFHGLMTDGIPGHSVDAATALLRRKDEVLKEARSILAYNLRTLRAKIGGIPKLSAPLWFDRGRRSGAGDRLARTALRSGVLVCPGSYFGDSRGVRIALTRRTFARDFLKYLAVRNRLPAFDGPAG